MKEFQFKVGNVWLDVDADTPETAVKLLNSQLPFLDEPLLAPGQIKRIQLDLREPVTVKDIVGVFDFKDCPALAAELRWNSEADEFNQWDSLDQSEQDTLISEQVAINALKQRPAARTRSQP